MANQRRQPPVAKRSAGSKRTRRLAFESLERRNVLSAIGLPMAVPMDFIAPPAYIGVMQPGRGDAMHPSPADMMAQMRTNSLSTPNDQSGTPMHRNGDSYDANSLAAALLPTTSISLGAGSSVTVEGNVVVSQETVTSPAASSVPFATVSGTWMAISALKCQRTPRSASTFRRAASR